MRDLLATETDECIPWPYSRTPAGYGQASDPLPDGTPWMVLVSTWACEQVNGPPPFPGAHAAHECGNGHLGCVNPRHVSWKTPKENAQDKIRMNRQPSILTEEDVREILALTDSARVVGLAYGVCKSAIKAIRSGRTWQHIHR